MKTLSLSRIFFLLLLIASISFLNKNVFALSDIQNSDFKGYIEKAYDEKVISGYSDDTFRPSKSVSFVEVLKIATNAGNRKDQVFTSGGEWYTGYKNLYNQKDIQNETNYKNDEAISRDFALYIILRQLNLDLKNYQSKNKNFSDVKSSSIFAPYIQFAKDTELVLGYNDGTFGPKQKVNRGEFAKMTWKILREDKEKILSKKIEKLPTTKVDTSTTVEKKSQAEIREGLLKAVNAYRQENGVAPLRASTQLNIIALEYAQDMAGKGYFSHTSPNGDTLVDRAGEKNYKASLLAENLGKGQKTIDKVMQDWKNSPTHNKNLLLADVSMVGFGCYGGYWVQEFAQPRDKNDNTTRKFIARN